MEAIPIFFSPDAKAAQYRVQMNDSDFALRKWLRLNGTHSIGVSEELQ
jgi:hypothetical protein